MLFVGRKQLLTLWHKAFTAGRVLPFCTIALSMAGFGLKRVQ